MLQRNLFFILFALTNLRSFAQIKVGQWIDHLSYNYTNSVAKVGNIVYVSNGQGLAKYNTTDNSIEKFTKIDGLSDVGVQLIRKCDVNNSLLVIYSNANIDVIKSDGSIINVSDIKRKSITGNKTINEVYFKGNLAYLACGFGIIVFDMDKLEIKDTYHVGNSLLNYIINQVTSNDSAVFAATNTGIYYGKSTANLSNYQNWKPLNTGLPNGPYNAIVNFDNKIIANYSEKTKSNVNFKDTLFQFTGGIWAKYPYKISTTNKKLYDYSKHNVLVITDQWGSSDYNPNGTINNYITNYNTSPQSYASINDLFYESASQFYLADNIYGLIDFKGSYNISKVLLNGPSANFANDIAIKDGNIALAPVNLGDIYTNQYNGTPPSLYQDNEWKSLTNIIPYIQDINCVAIDPIN